jgi:hypothetical protein
MRRIHIYIVALLLFLVLVGYVFFIRDIERDIVTPHRQGGPLRWDPSPPVRFSVLPEPFEPIWRQSRGAHRAGDRAVA